jgi:hypothetical protein
MKQDERGQIVVLTLGLVLLCFAISGLAVDGTRSFLARRTLQNAADSAALAGAGALDQDTLYESGGRTVAIDEGLAEREAALILRRRGISARAAISADEGHVRVLLRTEVPTSFLRLIGISSMAVGADSVAAPLSGPR